VLSITKTDRDGARLYDLSRKAASGALPCLSMRYSVALALVIPGGTGTSTGFLARPKSRARSRLQTYLLVSWEAQNNGISPAGGSDNSRCLVAPLP
jgi:hypothetical protein